MKSDEIAVITVVDMYVLNFRQTVSSQCLFGILTDVVVLF